MRTRTCLFVAAFILLAGGFQTSAFAMSRMGGAVGFRGGFHTFRSGDFHRTVVVRPAFDFGWGWGYPWYWGPYYYGYPGSYAVEGSQANYGAVEFKVKPDNTKVYVDQKFIGSVNDLDHHKAYMADGNHDIKLVAKDGRTIERSVFVAGERPSKSRRSYRNYRRLEFVPYSSRKSCREGVTASRDFPPILSGRNRLG